VHKIHFRSFFLGFLLTAVGAFFLQRMFTPVSAQGAGLTQVVCQDLDVNNDGTVNVIDYSEMAKYFLKSCTSLTAGGGGVASPAPSTIASAVPTPKPTPSPTPKPTPKPTPSPSPVPSPVASPAPSGSPTSTDPSGESMPVGDLPGWKQIYTENFSRPVAMGKGTFMKVYSDNFWQIYDDNYPDTAGKNWGQPSVYYPSKVLSVANGVLTKNVHVEGGKPMAAGLFAKVNKSDKEGAQLYGKYTIRFRVYANNSTSLKGFKMAWLLWPKSQKWPKDGEIDFPEGDFAGKIWAAMHRQEGKSGDDQDLYFSDTGFDGKWHTASMEWGPDKMVFILDGKVLGTSTKRIPNTPMFWVIQTESCYDVCPNANANGNVEIDWMTAYSRVQ
jgi:hypothetical protein